MAKLGRFFGNAINQENWVNKLRSALADTKLLSGGDAMSRANKCIKALGDMRKAEGEGWSDAAAKQTFLNNVEDSAFRSVVEIVGRSKANMTFDGATHAICGKFSELKRDALRRKRKKQHARRATKRQKRQEDLEPEEEEVLGHRARRAQEKKPAALPKTIFLDDNGKIRLNTNHCRALRKEGRESIKARNDRVANGKDFTGLKFPKGVAVKENK